MKDQNSTTGDRQSDDNSGFRISGGPVVSNRMAAPVPEYGQLPASYGAPIFFAIARDPQTIFTYWNIDWSHAFGPREPVDRRVYLRLKRRDGSDEIEEPIEPMLGTHFVSVSQPSGAYQVELGFYHPAQVWNSIATSDQVKMPAQAASENLDVDVATVPFHLSFQRMIDLFRANHGDAVASLLSRLQDRAGATADAGSALSAEEREILHAMDISLSDLQGGRRGFGGRALEDLLRKRAEAMLGFGGTSPAGGGGGPGGSSWSSGLS
jgi:hypothetical protein